MEYTEHPKILCFLLTYLLSYVLTYSMEQSPSWEGNRFSASQEIPRILWNPKVQYHIHQCPPPVPISISPGPRLSVRMFRNNMSFYGEELLAPRPTPKLEDHTLSAIRDCLFNIFAAPFHIGGRSSIRSLRTRHAVVSGNNLSRNIKTYLTKLATLLTWRLGFVHPWCSVWSLITVKPKLTIWRLTTTIWVVPHS